MKCECRVTCYGNGSIRVVENYVQMGVSVRLVVWEYGSEAKNMGEIVGG